MQSNSFQSAHRLALTSIIFLGITVICYFLEIIYNLVFISFFPDLGEAEDLTAGEWIMSLSALALLSVKFLAYVGSIVFFLMWLYRAYKNLEAMNVRNLEASPGWAVGYWFIPILNLFKPVKIVSEVYNGSDPEIAREGYGFANAATPALLVFWWACWLLSNITSRVSEAMERAAKDVTDASVMVYIGSLSLGIVAGVLLIFIIKEIDNRQAECERNLTIQQPPTPPVFNPPNQAF